MKEYHSAKAKTPSDLPAWLFPPEQRSVLHAWEEEPPTSRRPQRGNASSLDDVFSSEPTKTHYTRRNYHRQDSQDSGYESGASSFSGSSIPPQQALGSRAATRLQSLRREGRPKVSNQTMEDEGAALFDKMPNTRSPPSMKRAGLPSRPQMKGSYDRI